MMKYLGITPGSVSPFALINDKENHVHVFLDENLKNISLNVAIENLIYLAIC